MANLHQDYVLAHTATQALPPQIKAFLDIVAAAESGPYSYACQFGTEVPITNFTKHPNKVGAARLKDGKVYRSTAAGRYQYLDEQWVGMAKRLHLKDFSPESQDKAAVATITDVGADKLIMKGKIAEAMNMTRNVWASLPGSNLGQPTRQVSHMVDLYHNRLDMYRREEDLEKTFKMVRHIVESRNTLQCTGCHTMQNAQRPVQQISLDAIGTTLMVTGLLVSKRGRAGLKQMLFR
jgi:muramidase (phage lysozyme)